MTDETTPWYSRTLAALKAAASWVVLDAAPAVWDWAKANRRPLGRFVVTLVLVLVITQLIIWTHQLTTRRVAEKVSAAPAQRAAVAADPLRQLDERVVALEVSVAGLLAAEAAPTTAPPRTRAAAVRQRAPAGPVVPESEPPAAAEPVAVAALPPITRQSLKQFRAELRGQE